MLSSRTVLDFVELIQLSLENDELTTLGGHDINGFALILLKGVDHLVEVLILEEKAIILQHNLFSQLLNWDAVGVLIKVLLQRRVLILLEPETSYNWPLLTHKAFCPF